MFDNAEPTASAAYVPKAGDTVYNMHGEMGLYVSTAKGGGYIVQPLIEDGDGVSEPMSQYAEGVDVWVSVFRQPPKPMIDGDIATLEARLSTLRQEVYALEAQKREAERDQSALKDRIGVHQALARIDDLLSGRVTHYVIDKSESHNHNWVVVPAEQFFTLRTHYSIASLTLHTQLYSTTKGAAQWKFSANAERDTGRDAFACMSEAEARAKVEELVHASLHESAKHSSNAYWLRKRIQWADAQGVSVPAEVRAKLIDLDRRETAFAIDKAKKDLEEAQARLAAIETTCPTTTG